MRVEVDQSGKIGDTKVPTVLAFANDESFAVLIPATVKRECVRVLRTRFRSPHQLYMRLFAAALFLLIEKHLAQIDSIVIDVEYTGHEGSIKDMLLRYVRGAMPTFSKEQIAFRYIGKRSPAHHKAYGVYVGHETAGRTVKSNDLLRLVAK